MQQVKSTIKTSIKSSISLPNAVLYLLKNTWSWWLIITPIIINIILTILLWGWLRDTSSTWVTSIFKPTENLIILEQAVQVLAWILSLLLSILGIIVLSLVVSGPFNGILAEKILIKHDIYQESRINGIVGIFKEIGRAINFEIGKILVSLIMLIVTSIINVIPIIGTFLYVAINFSFSGFINTLDFYDPALSLLEYDFKAKLKYLKNNIFDNLLPIGFTALIINIPIINAMYMPVAITAASLQLVERLKLNNNTK